MSAPGPASGTSPDDALGVFEESERPVTPLTTDEIADKLGWELQATLEKLGELVDGGTLGCRTVSDRQIWWPTAAGSEDACHEDGLQIDEANLSEQLLEIVPVSISIIEPTGELVRANSRTIDLLGIQESDLDQYRVDSWNLYDADGELITFDETPWADIVETGETVRDYECQVELPELGRRWVSVNASALHSADGGYLVFAVDDITEQKEREQQLRRERNQTRELLQTAPIAISVQDSEGKTVTANERAQELLGLSEQEILNGPPDITEWRIFDADGNEISPDETPSARVHASGEPVFDEEIVIERPDGEQRWFAISAAPVFDADGDLERVITAGENISKLKRRERELELRKAGLETELSGILGRISDAFYALDDEWRFTHVNDRAEELLEHDRDELLDETFWDVFPDAAGSEVGERFRDAVETNEPVSLEYEYEDLDIWIEINAYPSESGLSVYFQDITARKERERELERYETIVETVDDGIYALDDELRFTTVNDSYAELVGVPREDLVGSPISVVVADQAVEMAKQLREGLRTGEIDGGTAEVEVQTATGDRIPTETAFAPLWFDDGEFSGTVGVVRDISERKEREQELAEQRERYRQLVESAPVTIAIYDADGDIVYINDEGAELVGAVNADAVIGEAAIEYVHPEDRREAAERMRRVIDGREAVPPKETRIVTDDGVKHTVITSVPIMNEGAPAAQLVVTDITDRKVREQELERYRTIVEAIDDGIYTVDPDGYFTMVNEAYAEMTGYPRDELPGSHVSLVVDDAVAEQAQDWEAELAAGEKDRAVVEAEVMRADGGTVPAEATFALFPSGDPYERIGVVRDITERKAQQRALVESERRYRTLVDHFPDGAVGLFDEGLRYTAVGGQLLDRVGLDPEDRIGHHISEAYPPEIVEEYGGYFEAVFEGEANAFESAFHGLHLYNQTLPVTDSDGEIIAGMLVSQDISERVEYRNQLEETIDKLEESNERLEQFAHVASHDLQEPLRMITSYLGILEEHVGDELDGKAQECIEYAVDGAERMRAMVQDLLTYSRLDTDAEPLEPTDSESVVRSALDNLSVQIEERQADIQVGSLPAVEADANQLEQVFQNLVSNAIKYCEADPPRVEIEAEPVDGMVRFRVADNGIGMDPAYTDQIFEVFKRLHTDDEYPGTGIGLALCRKIVERHGGDIWVDSAPGEGATFSFTIPQRSGNV